MGMSDQDVLSYMQDQDTKIGRLTEEVDYYHSKADDLHGKLAIAMDALGRIGEYSCCDPCCGQDLLIAEEALAKIKGDSNELS